MAQFSPFYGYRFSNQNLSRIITPPYDVISPQKQREYYDSHPNNIIRLEYGLQENTDTDSNNRYTRAQNYYELWKQQGVLAKDNKPSFYLYRQDFILENKSFCRTGILGTLKTVPYQKGEVLPHEETLSGPKQDRLQLLRHCKANFSPIFGLYDDPANTISSISAYNSAPAAAVTDEEGVTHRLWVIDNPTDIALIQKILAPLPVFIADGHHRYETALAYSQEDNFGGHDQILICLVNIHDPGLVILPTHRVIHDIDPQKINTLLSSIPPQFKIQKTTADTIAPNSIHLISGKGRWSIRWDPKSLKSTSPRELLEVVILDRYILEPLLGIDAENQRQQKNLVYVKDAETVNNMVVSGEGQLGFILPSPRIEQVTEVAAAKEKMPQKSTYFSPKITTGLVINDLRESCQS